MNTQWQDFLGRQGAVINGNSVDHFGNPELELTATAEATIMADLSHLGLWQVDGDDTVPFLQGQLTNDLKLLNGSNSQYAGYCTAKGRLLAIFLAYAHAGHLHLQVNGALAETVIKRLRMYVLRSKVTFTDVTDSIVRIGLAGPQASAALTAAFGACPQQVHDLLTLEHATLLRLPGATARYEIFAAPEHAAKLWEQLGASATPVGSECWNWLDIQAGIPDIAPATVEAFVPQMVNLDLLNGINFKKGCYTGQEIVARTHYLGKVKRRTLLAHVDGDHAPQAAEPVFGSGTAEPVGQIVRAAPAPGGGFDLLAEVRGESLAAGALRWAAADGAELGLLPMPYPVE